MTLKGNTSKLYDINADLEHAIALLDLNIENLVNQGKEKEGWNLIQVRNLLALKVQYPLSKIVDEMMPKPEDDEDIPISKETIIRETQWERIDTPDIEE